MVFFDPQPVVAASSEGFSITSQSRVADPFTPANITWTEIENSTSEAWAGFWINWYSLVARGGMVLIATGAASSEVIIFSHPVITHIQDFSKNVWCPIPIPSGTRLSIGISTNGAVTLIGQINGVPSTNFDAEPSWTVFETGPYNLTNTGEYGKPAKIDPEGTANTKGSYSEVSQLGTNGTNNIINGDDIDQVYDYFGFMLSGILTSAQTTQNRLVDIAYGAAASETIYLADKSQYVSSIEIGSMPAFQMVPWGRAIGDRISARSTSSITDATDRIAGIYLCGVR